MSDKKNGNEGKANPVDELAERIAEIVNDIPKGTHPFVRDHLNAAYKALTGNNLSA